MTLPAGSRINPNELPYLDKEAARDRVIPIVPFYSQLNKDWFLYLKEEDGSLIRLAGGEVAVGMYLSERLEDPDRDVELPFNTFIFQHLTSPRVTGLLLQLTDDMHNFSSILEKYLILSSQVQDSEAKRGIYQLFYPEVEYLVILIRSYYDLFQKLAKQLMATVRRIDVPEQRLSEDLPDSFSKVVLLGNSLRSQEEIEQRFRLPPALAAFYAKEGDQFLLLRKIRVAIEHHGFTPSLIFQHNEGLAISVNEEPWNALPIWRPDIIRDEHLAPLRLVFLHLIREAMVMPVRFVEAFVSCIAVLPPLAPGWSLYLRDYYSHHLTNLDAAIADPWAGSKQSRLQKA